MATNSHSHHPNFPPSLDIHPSNATQFHVTSSSAADYSHLDSTAEADAWNQATNIAKYGIAGRIW